MSFWKATVSICRRALSGDFRRLSAEFPAVPENAGAGGEHFDQTSTVGLHYRIDYLTPYWDPQGGFSLDLAYEGGVAGLEKLQGLNEGTAQISTLRYLPDLTPILAGCPRVQEAARPALEWLADTRLAVRLYGATGLPTRGEFFAMGGSTPVPRLRPITARGQQRLGRQFGMARAAGERSDL